jgi:hypothetical protein
MQTAVRVNRLLRSLVGIVDMRTEWLPAGTLRNVHILRESTMHDHQIVRNVVSGLEAGLGIRLAPSSVRVHGDASAFGVAVAPLDIIAALQAPAAVEPPSAIVPPKHDNGAPVDAGHPVEHHAPKQNGRPSANGNGHGHQHGRGRHAMGPLPGPEPVNGTHYLNGAANGHSNGARNGAARSARVTAAVPSTDSASKLDLAANGIDAELPDAAPQPGAATIQRVVIERHGGMLRCRVAVEIRGCTYAAAAEVPDGTNVEAELAARVTLDALRAARLTTARLDGIEYARIGDITYVVATLREPTSPASRPSAAPLIDDTPRAAAQAVLNAMAPSRAANTDVDAGPRSGRTQLKSEKAIG